MKSEVVVNSVNIESEIPMCAMECGILYTITAGSEKGQIVMRYSNDVVVILSKPAGGELWSDAGSCPLRVRRCLKGSSITIEQE